MLRHSKFNITAANADTLYFYSNMLTIFSAVLSLIASVRVFTGELEVSFAIVTAALALVGGCAVYITSRIRDNLSNIQMKAYETKIADAQVKLAQANEQIEKAKVEELKLKKQMQWRDVTEEQAELIIGLLSKFKIKLLLSFVKIDPEAVLYRERLHDVLIKAGVEVSFYSGYERAIGLGIRGNDLENINIILDAFNSAGIPMFYSSGKPFPIADIEILVGSKEPPVF